MAKTKESPTKHNDTDQAAAPGGADLIAQGASEQRYLITSSEQTLTAAAIVQGNGNGTITVMAEARENASTTHENGAATKKQLSAELVEKVKELVRLSHEQGHLTFGDINDSLPDTLATPENIEEIIIQLRNLEVDIVDQAEVDRVKEADVEEDDEKSRLDILDDPVRMYLKQMGQVPLLTREQEVEISKRIEDAEKEVKKIVYSFGFAGKEHIALAEKLLSEPPKERFDRVVVDKKIEGRENHLKALQKLIKVVKELDEEVDRKYDAFQKASGKQAARGFEQFQ